MINISLQQCKVLAPNCGGADTITVLFTLEDAEGHQATVSLIGAKNALNNITDTQSLQLDGVNGNSTYVNPFGAININSNYQVGYDINRTKTVKMDVEDCKGWQNIEAAIGFTDAVMSETNNFLMDESGDYIAFL